MVQWVTICLPVQGTWVQPPVQEDPPRCGAIMPVCHNHCSLPALEPVLCNRRSHCNEKPEHHNQRVAPCSPQLEKAQVQQDLAKNKCINKYNCSERRDFPVKVSAYQHGQKSGIGKELDKSTELKGCGSYIYEGWCHRGTVIGQEARLKSLEVLW